MVAVYGQPTKLKPRKGRPPRWLFPQNAERSYIKLANTYTATLKKIANEIFIPSLPTTFKAFNDSSTFTDSFLDEIKRNIFIARTIFNDSSIDIESFLKTIGVSINTANKIQSAKQTKFAFNLDLFTIEPWAKDATESWVSENVSLIKSIPDTYFREIEELMTREIRAGTRVEKIAELIANKTGVSQSRGLLIARDQVGKFNGQLTKKRQEDAGVTQYKWRTVRDERVRPTHRENDGKIFSWDKRPEKTGPPGHDIQCRCYAEPIFTADS